MKRLLFFIVATLLIIFSGQELAAQGFLKKAAKKLQKEAEEVISGDGDEAQDESNNDAPEDLSTGSSQNKSSGAKKMAPPDVKKNIDAAETAYAGQNYDNTRFAVQQALLGIELEIGYEILRSLPSELSSLKSNDENDHVTSTGIGFAGLHIERMYESNDRGIDLRILNNTGMIGAMSAVMTNPMYADENQKAVMVGGYKGLLELKDDSYFSLGIPIGQSSLISMDFDNFNDEESVLAAAEEIDINEIKSLLGEQ